MPSYRHHDFGNLYIQFDVKFPKKLKIDNPAQIDVIVDQLEKIIPPELKTKSPPDTAMTEDFELEDVDAGQQARAQGASRMDEDDEEAGPQGGERMQCASQ